jgi:magnesium transporter
MITTYLYDGERLVAGDAGDLCRSPQWVDLLEPTADEEHLVEKLLGINVPTREEMQEIEASSRLYREEQAAFVTAPLLANADGPYPQSTAVTFILLPGCVITVRYATPRAFQNFSARATRHYGPAASSDLLLIGLLEAVVDRLADVLECVGAALDDVSHSVFRTDPTRKERGTDYTAILAALGRNGDLSSKARESLQGLVRSTGFLAQAASDLMGKSSHARLETMERDIRSLIEHAGFVSSKIAFLLDATLGMINIEQNNIIKIFSVVAFVFLPPTLIASIYGMNFQGMPELQWPFGYPFALGLMVCSAILPYVLFKKKGWL